MAIYRLHGDAAGQTHLTEIPQDVKDPGEGIDAVRTWAQFPATGGGISQFADDWEFPAS